MSTITLELSQADIAAFAAHMRERVGHNPDTPEDVVQSAVVLMIERAAGELVKDADWTRRHWWYLWDDCLEAAQKVPA